MLKAVCILALSLVTYELEARITEDPLNNYYTMDRSIWDWITGHFTTTPPPTPPPTPPENCDKCECGQPNIKRRIVGGTETMVLEFPWMALLLYGGKFFCGGSLISDRHILTAGHCTDGFNPDRISVRLLEHDKSTTNETETISRKIATVNRHPRYDSNRYDNDIAILRLKEPVNVTGLLRPVCLPTPQLSFVGMTSLVTGWGALSEGGSTSDTLQQVEVPVLSNDECKKDYGDDKITDNMLCAGLDEGGKDSCQGDSGGPLMIHNETISRYQEIGVVSWGEGCARPKKPGVYARVNRYGTWIRSNTRDGCYCNSG